jgi:hypothetical protein
MVLLFFIAEWNITSGLRIGFLASVVVIVTMLALVFFGIRGMYWLLLPSRVGSKPRFRNYRRSFLILTVLFLGVWAPSISLTSWENNIPELAGDSSPSIDPFESIDSSSADSLGAAKLAQLEVPVQIVGAMQILGKSGLSYALYLYCGDKFLEIAYPVSSSPEGSILVAPNLNVQGCEREFELSDGVNKVPVFSEVGISGKILVFSVQYEFESYHINLKTKQSKAFVWDIEHKTPKLRPVSTVNEAGLPVIDVDGDLIGFTDGTGGTNLFVDKDFLWKPNLTVWRGATKY